MIVDYVRECMPQTEILGRAIVNAAVNAVTAEPLTRNEMVEPGDTVYWGYDRHVDALFLTLKESAVKTPESPDSGHTWLIGERELSDDQMIPIPAKAVAGRDHANPEIAVDLQQNRPLYFAKTENRPNVAYFVPAQHSLIKR